MCGARGEASTPRRPCEVANGRPRLAAHPPIALHHCTYCTHSPPPSPFHSFQTSNPTKPQRPAPKAEAEVVKDSKSKSKTQR